jgi:hypothetical protein
MAKPARPGLAIGLVKTSPEKIMTQANAPPAEAPHIEGARPDRAGKTMIGGYFDDAVNIQMKLLGLETGRRTSQELLTEAINLLFQHYGKPRIATYTPGRRRRKGQAN